MEKELKQVLEFHKAFKLFFQVVPNAGLPQGKEKEIKNLRIKLIQEEYDELIMAMEADDIGEIAHELADLLYVIYGTILTYGLQEMMLEVFEAVHVANMSKLDTWGKPIFREDGKIEKSYLYEAPPIKQIMEQHLYSDIKIADHYELSRRCLNIMEFYKIYTLFDLLQYSEREILSLRNMGLKSFLEIERLLERYGLRLRREG